MSRPDRPLGYQAIVCEEASNPGNEAGAGESRRTSFHIALWLKLRYIFIGYTESPAARTVSKGDAMYDLDIADCIHETRPATNCPTSSYA